MFWKLLQRLTYGSEIASVYQIPRLEGNTELWKSVTHEWLGLVCSNFRGSERQDGLAWLLRSRLKAQVPGRAGEDENGARSDSYSIISVRGIEEDSFRKAMISIWTQASNQ